MLGASETLCDKLTEARNRVGVIAVVAPSPQIGQSAGDGGLTVILKVLSKPLVILRARGHSKPMAIAGVIPSMAVRGVICATDRRSLSRLS